MTKYNHILAIDPGVTGSFTLIEFDKDGGEIRVNGRGGLSKLPLASTIIAGLAERDKETIVLCEAERPSPVMGVMNAGKFMKDYGFLLGVLFANEIPVRLVPPQLWQRGLPVPHGDRKKLKDALWELAKRFDSSVHKQDADSLLIAVWGAYAYINETTPGASFGSPWEVPVKGLPKPEIFIQN